MQKPRFNFTWLYILLIAGLAFMIFTRHDTSASRSVDYTTFKERFEPFGLVVEVLSRFRTNAQQHDILERFAQGL